MQITDIFNTLKEMIYIADIETNDLIFINEALKEHFHLESCEGLKCHTLLQGISEPCQFCTINELKKGNIHTWESCIATEDQKILIKDMLFDFQGRKTHLAIIEDIADDKVKNQKLNYALNMERITINCIKHLYKTEDPKNSIQYILQQIGHFLNADRAYIFEFKDNVMNNTYEWCAPGIESQLDFCQNMDVNLLGMWQDYIAQGKSAMISDVSDLKEKYKDSYEALKSQNIKSLVISPLIIQNKMEGYLGVDNPKPDENNHIIILDTLSYFLGIALEKMRMNETLVRASYFDAHTGLYNRNKYNNDVEQFSSLLDSTIAIVYMDINGLKDINDSLGHRYGDKILLEGAKVLRTVFPNSNIYRVGGDEFVVLSVNMSEETLKYNVDILEKHFLISLDCKGAIGWSWTDDCNLLPQKISEADEKMYQDKMEYYHSNPATKRYRYYNDPTLMLSQKKILLEALESNKFEVYLQPKVNFKNRHIIGAEALIRYHSSDDNLIPPDQFIPWMEEARTIFYIDYYVFETTCKLMHEWFQEIPNIPPISVNCSRYTLMRPDFIEHLESVWNKYQFPKDLIEIEIIESAEDVDNEKLIIIMERIKQAGFKICIDDFGIRCSNMALFVNVNLNVLKLDKSMILDIVSNKKSQMLVGALAEICHTQNLQLIVEGVETEEQFEVLHELGCDGLQGFLISKPIPIAKFKEIFLLPII